MGYYLSIPILVIAAAIQSTILPQFRIDNGQPDLIFLLVVAWAVHASLQEGIVWAFVGGMLQDLLSITPLGTSVIGMLLAVFALNALRHQLYRVGIIMITGVTLFGTVLQEAITLLILQFIGFGTDIVAAIGNLLLPTLFYNLVLILPVFFIVRRIQKRLPGSNPTPTPERGF